MGKGLRIWERAKGYGEWLKGMGKGYSTWERI